MKSRSDFKTDREFTAYLAIYYAGLAPECPEWFKHNAPDPIKAKNPGTYDCNFNQNSRDALDHFIYVNYNYETGIWDYPDLETGIGGAAKIKLETWKKYIEAYFEEKERFDFHNNQARFFQWRTYYGQTLAVVSANIDISAVKQWYPIIFEKDGKRDI